MISCGLPPNRSALSWTQEIAADTSFAPAGQVAAGASRYETLKATSPFCAAKHIACSTSGFSAGASPPPAKLSPATNTSTGRFAPLVCADVTSRTFMASPPYFRPRVKVTPAQDESAVLPDAAPMVGAGVATGEALVAGSSVNPIGMGSRSRDGRLPGSAIAAAVMISQKPNARHFFIFGPHRYCSPSSHPRAVMGRFDGMCRARQGPSMGALNAGRQMLSGDVTEGERRAERDTGARIVAAHDARHVVARGIKPGDDFPLGIERTGVLVGLDAGIGAEIADHELERI